MTFSSNAYGPSPSYGFFLLYIIIFLPIIKNLKSTNARLKGLSSEILSFLFSMLHRTLATKERLHKTNQENSAICNQCDKGEIDDYEHALSSCTKSEPCFNWMMTGLRAYNRDLTADKVLHLDIVPDNPLPHGSLPLVWFAGNTLHHLWKLRSSGKQCHLYVIRSELEAEISILRKSNMLICASF